MTKKNRTTLICNCENTMSLDGKAIGDALGISELKIHTHLCRSGIKDFEAALGDEQICVGCTQEASLFSEIAEEAGKPEPFYFNIREKAGWSSNGKKVAPKMAALIALANLEQKPARAKSIQSDGLCLVTGHGQAAFDAANLLNKNLSVTLLLSNSDGVVLPPVLDFPVFCGSINQASGTLGAFEIIVDDYASLLPSSKGDLQFAMTRDGAKSSCSVIFDLTGASPLFTRHEGRDGYFRADPKDPAAVMRAIIDAGDMVGEFEKPIYVGYNSEICAHSRSQKTGCSKCIDNCPAGAIATNGDVVAIDTDICGGCGNCAAHCPTGAVYYQYPERHDHIRAIQTLASTYLGAGGKDATLLCHDGKHGLELINAMARFGKGLPASVIPLEMHSTSGIGHDAMAAALGAGFSRVVILGNPRNREEYEAIAKEIELTHSLTSAFGFGEERISLEFETDPDKFEAILWSLAKTKKIASQEFLPLGNKREVARTAIGILADAAKSKIEIVPLIEGAPYGSVQVNTDGCTLCLACVSSCPADALRDNPDKPQLRFVETACVQCGICATTCPEKVISLMPQLNLSPSAMQPVTLYEEEPFECIKCHTPFASKSTIERISEQLAGSHRMFESKEQQSLLKMCDSCRLETLAAGGGDPFEIAHRPVPRTTDDYIVAEREGPTIDDFLSKDKS